jgi:hypothetical protein
MLQHNNNKIFFYFFFLETFQSHRGYSIAVGDDGCAAALVGLKCFKGKKEKLKNKIILFFFKKNFKFHGTHA